MKRKRNFQILNSLVSCAIALLLCSIIYDSAKYIDFSPKKDKHVLVLYDPLYGSPSVDQKYVGWNCKRGEDINARYEPPNDLPVVSFPQKGLYSTHDPNIISAQLKEIRESGINVILIQWYGINRTSTIFGETDDFAVQTIDLLMNECKNYRLKIAIYLKNYIQRNNQTFFNDLEFIANRWLNKPQYAKFHGRKLIFVEEPFKNEQIFHTINYFKKHQKIFFVSSFTQLSSVPDALEFGFDAVLALPNFEKGSYSSKYEKWLCMKKEAHIRGLSFFPSIIPGYNSSITSILEYDKKKKKSRLSGDLYKAMFEQSINDNDGIIVINSFNNWIEGTNIEPAIDKGKYKFDQNIWSGSEGQPNDFLSITKYYTKLFRKKKVKSSE